MTDHESRSIGNRFVKETYSKDDRIEPVLEAQKRRILDALLDKRTMAADPILCEGRTLDSAEYLTICYELHHILLPELADMRLVEFDRDEDEVRRGQRFDEVRQCFEQIADDRDK